MPLLAGSPRFIQKKYGTLKTKFINAGNAPDGDNSVRHACRTCSVIVDFSKQRVQNCFDKQAIVLGRPANMPVSTR
jgi:hypothetical protein